MNVLHDKDRYLLRKLDLEGEKILKSWPNLEDIEVGFAPVPWTMNMLTLESVDEEKRKHGQCWKPMLLLLLKNLIPNLG